MRILKIQKNKLFMDTGEVIDISRGIILEYSLVQGMELGEEKYTEVLSSAALHKAYFLLSRRDYSKKELSQKLESKFHRGDVVESVVAKLSQQGYIDDYSYTKAYVQNRRYGRRRVEYELFQKGVSRDIVSQVYRELSIDEKNEIRRLIPRISGKDREKQVAYLARRGFNLDDIVYELKNYPEDD